MDESTKVRRSDRAVYRKLADGEGGVLLHLDTAAYHGVNEVGALIWDRLGEATTLGALLQELGEEFEAPPSGWERDIADFVHALAHRDLVRTEAGS